MKINHKVLSLPPFISTSWKNIFSLHMEDLEQGPVMVILLKNGVQIEIPSLDPLIAGAIFTAHAQYLEELPSKTPPPLHLNEALQKMGFAHFSIGMEEIENRHNALEHNPNQMDLPDIPKEIIDKLVSISHIMGIENFHGSSKAESDCKCIHCQIARVIDQEKQKEISESIEEEVTLEDLRFRLWDINETGHQLYRVSNPLDTQEHYDVILRDPIGCTCGEKNCEHIHAVLNS